MKKLFLFLMLFCGLARADILDLKVSTAQIFDVQWYISGNTLYASGFNYIYSSVNYATQTTSAARLTSAQYADINSVPGRYIGFFNSTTNPGTYGMAVFNSDGTKYKILNNTGSFRALADGAIFYNGNGMWGTLFTTKSGYSLGQSANFAVTQSYPTNTQLQTYLPPSSTPLAAGQTATQTPIYSATITQTQQNQINDARARQTIGNQVNITQVGSYNNIDVIQSGTYHLVDVNLGGDSNDVGISQYGKKNYSKVLMNGFSNHVDVYQTNSGGAAVTGHFSAATIMGDTNTVNVYQTGDGEKQSFININGNSNTITNNQYGTGSKYADIKATGNGHTLSLDQKDGGNHAARIDVTNNGGASNINVIQQGNTNQTYSIQQSCATAGGCSVTITQQ